MAVQNRRGGCYYEIVTMALLLFQYMFSDSEIVKTFTMGRSKASYVFQDVLEPLLANWLCQSVYNLKGVFKSYL